MQTETDQKIADLGAWAIAQARVLTTVLNIALRNHPNPRAALAYELKLHELWADSALEEAPEMRDAVKHYLSVLLQAKRDDERSDDIET